MVRKVKTVQLLSKFNDCFGFFSTTDVRCDHGKSRRAAFAALVASGRGGGTRLLVQAKGPCSDLRQEFPARDLCLLAGALLVEGSIR